MINIDVDEVIKLTLVKSHTGWEFQIPLAQFDYLRRNKYESNNKVVIYFIENIKNIIHERMTNKQVLPINKEIVANWILNEEI